MFIFNFYVDLSWAGQGVSIKVGFFRFILQSKLSGFGPGADRCTISFFIEVIYLCVINNNHDFKRELCGSYLYGCKSPTCFTTPSYFKTSAV